MASSESHYGLGSECKTGSQLAALAFSDKEIGHFLHRKSFSSLKQAQARESRSLEETSSVFSMGQASQ